MLDEAEIRKLSFLFSGFVDGAIEQFPVERKALYNYQRNSKALVKLLS